MRAHRTQLLVMLIVSVLCGQISQAQRTRPAGKKRDWFASRDANDDGVLTRDELPKRVSAENFQRADADGDGKITREEFRGLRRRGQRRAQRGKDLPKPDLENVRYGPHERNVFDLWKAKADGPVPLVIYYHGGGFRRGDKRSLSSTMLKSLLKAGVSVAAVNYRLSDVAPFPAQMHDSARALQFLRLSAVKYGIDPKRVGATGGSAGAGISQWLAFHEDLADPKSADPVRKQSTRLTCAVVFAAQTSYDPRFIRKLFNTTQMHPALPAFFDRARAW